MGDERKIRNCFYTKIDQNKSLDILLREQPPDLLLKVSQLTSRHGLSINRRKQVWQLLLDVISADHRIAESRIEIQRSIVCSLLSALHLIGAVSEIKLEGECQVEHDSRTIVLIHLFQSKQLDIDYDRQIEQDEQIQDYLSVASVFVQEFIPVPSTENSLEDTFWLFKNFVANIDRYSTVLFDTYEKFVYHLHKDDNELFTHLVTNGIVTQSSSDEINNQRSRHPSHQPTPCLPMSSLKHHNACHSQRISHHSKPMFAPSAQSTKYKFSSRRPLITWFVRFFAGFIHQNFIIRIFDKIICCFVHGARYFHVLISIAKNIISHSRSELLHCHSYEQITRRLFMPLSLEESEQIVIKSLAT